MKKNFLMLFIFIFCVVFMSINAPIGAQIGGFALSILENNAKKLQDEPETGSGVHVKVEKPAQLKQGDSLVVYVDSKEPLVEPQISINNQLIKLYPIAEGRYRALVGFNAVTKPGGYTLKAFDETGKLNYKEVIEVYNSHFPIQNIRISGSKASLTPTEDELTKIQVAKDLVSDIAYWSQPPFVSPTRGCKISPYGRTRYHNGKSTGDFHKGIDIKAPTGQAIKATEAGKVIIAEPFRLHGGTVAVDHGQGMMSIYIHMSKISVKKGDYVSRGQKLGEVGSTGFATGPHLHWGLYLNGVSINPDKWATVSKSCW